MIDQSEDEGVAARLGAKIAHAEKRMPELRRELIDAPAQTGGVSGSAVKSGLIADGDAEQKMKDAVQLLKVAKQEMKEAIQLFKEAKQEMKEAEWKMMDLEAIRARERGRQPTMEDFPPTVQGPFNALYAGEYIAILYKPTNFNSQMVPTPGMTEIALPTPPVMGDTRHAATARPSRSRVFPGCCLHRRQTRRRRRCRGEAGAG